MRSNVSTIVDSRFVESGLVRALRRPAVLLILAGIVLVVAAGEVSACPTCKDGVAEADPEGMNLARGYFYSILIMLAMPFTLAGSFGAYVWREMRRQERDRIAAGITGASPEIGAGPDSGRGATGPGV